MTKKFSQRTEDLRQALAQEAARIMAEHGIGDFLQAKRKAADRLGVNDVSVLPKNIEIEAALRAHQRLFGRETHDNTLKEQRRIALQTMRLLAEFKDELAMYEIEKGTIRFPLSGPVPVKLIERIAKFRATE